MIAYHQPVVVLCKFGSVITVFVWPSHLHVFTNPWLIICFSILHYDLFYYGCATRTDTMSHYYFVLLQLFLYVYAQVWNKLLTYMSLMPPSPAKSHSRHFHFVISHWQPAGLRCSTWSHPVQQENGIRHESCHKGWIKTYVITCGWVNKNSKGCITFLLVWYKHSDSIYLTPIVNHSISFARYTLLWGTQVESYMYPNSRYIYLSLRYCGLCPCHWRWYDPH